MNGIRALTEGFGPLLFGLLMFLCQDTSVPGAPYLLAAALSLAALGMSNRLPSDKEILEVEKNVLRTEVGRGEGQATPHDGSKARAHGDRADGWRSL